MTGAAPGRRALALMDAVIAKRPDKDGHALAEAMRCLCEHRDAISPGDWPRAPAWQRERLARLNAIISVVMGLHFPIGEAPWDAFAAARDWLAALLDEAPAPMAARR